MCHNFMYQVVIEATCISLSLHVCEQGYRTIFSRAWEPNIIFTFEPSLKKLWYCRKLSCLLGIYESDDRLEGIIDVTRTTTLVTFGRS